MEKADESLLPCPWCRGHNLSVGFSDGVGNISVHCLIKALKRQDICVTKYVFFAP